MEYFFGGLSGGVVVVVVVGIVLIVYVSDGGGLVCFLVFVCGLFGLKFFCGCIFVGFDCGEGWYGCLINNVVLWLVWDMVVVLDVIVGLEVGEFYFVLY